MNDTNACVLDEGNDMDCSLGAPLTFQYRPSLSYLVKTGRFKSGDLFLREAKEEAVTLIKGKVTVSF